MRWDILLGYRELALASLEAFRAQKHHPLEAEVTLTPSPADRDVLAAHEDLLPDLLGVSQVRLAPAAEEPSASVAQAGGHRCQRCWKWEPSLQDDLCPGCASVVSALSEDRVD